LGAKKNNWKFLTSEADDSNFENAKKNIEKNQLQDSIEGKDTVC